LDSLVFALDPNSGPLLTGLAALLGALGVFFTGVLKFFRSPKGDEEGDDRPEWAQDLERHIDWLQNTLEENKRELDAARDRADRLHERIEKMQEEAYLRDREWQERINLARAEEKLLQNRIGQLEERAARYRRLYEQAVDQLPPEDRPLEPAP